MHHPIHYSRDRIAARPRRAAMRSAFTLIEMLVVLAIMTALLSLVALVAPRFGERQRPSRGAGQLQSWLNLAKNRALRDQRPRGIRLPWITGVPPGATYITELQFIELPEVFTGGTLWIPDISVTASPPVPQNRYQFVTLTGVELGDPTNPPFDVYDILDPGADFGAEADRVRRIVKINWTSATQCTIMLDRVLRDVTNPSFTSPPAPTQAYRILRQNRAMPGEPVLNLPKDVGIDISREAGPVGSTPNWYRLYPGTANSGVLGPFDIMFDPSGRVIGPESTLGSRICLWVRDVSRDYPPTEMPDGDNTLITIYTRTGQISAHPVDPSGLQLPPSGIWNPFRFTQDAKSSGAQ